MILADAMLISDTIQGAFNEATKYFKESLTQDEYKRIWLNGMTSLKDVEDVHLEAKEKYDSFKKSRARVWLSKFSARLLYYGAIIDTLSQHHPEYVSLVWGATKFLFIAVMNQEELITELSKALSLIADALPRVNLSTVLYPTEAMKQAVAMLYARIIKFFHRAMLWYKESKIKHMLTSITRPVSLRYKDLITNILEHSERVDKLATSSAHAEIRDMHKSQDNMSLQISELDIILRTWMSKNGWSKQFALMLQESRELVGRNISQLEQRLVERIEAQQKVNTSRHLSITTQLKDLQWSSIMQHMSVNGIVDPVICLDHCKARYKQLLASGTLTPMPSYSRDLPQYLQTWADRSESGLIYLKGSPLFRGISQCLAIELVGLLRSNGAPVIWALNSHQKGCKLTTRVDVIKHLVLQILQINPNIRRREPLTTAAFYTARDEEHWFKVMAEALSGMLSVFVVFGLDILKSEDEDGFSWLWAFMDLCEQLRRSSCRTILRISLISCKYASALSNVSSGGNYGIDIVPISSRSQIQSMTQSPSRNRRLATRASAPASRRSKRKGKA